MMHLRSNGGTMMELNQAKVPGYKMRVWFRENAITNIVYLKNLGDQYFAAYKSDEKMSIFHRETEVTCSSVYMKTDFITSILGGNNSLLSELSPKT